METQERAATKQCSKCKETKPVAEFYKDKTKKDGHESRCKICAKRKATKYRDENKDLITATRARDADKNNAKAKAVYYSDIEASRAQGRITAQAARDRNPENARIATNKWRTEKREDYLVSRGKHTAKRRNLKMSATPYVLTEWEELVMSEIYSQASELSRLTGVKHEVDHIIPLIHNKVCGLHNISNLQILTQTENRKKSNRLMI